MNGKLLQKNEKLNKKFITWSDASIAALANQIKYKRPKCLILLIGTKINRAALQKDRTLLLEHGFELVKSNNFYLTSVLNGFFKKSDNFFKHYCSGYTLFAISRRAQKQNLPALFSLPYWTVVPTMVFEKQAVFSSPRLDGLFLSPHNLKNTTMVCGATSSVLLLLALKKFIYTKLQSIHK